MLFYTIVTSSGSYWNDVGSDDGTIKICFDRNYIYFIEVMADIRQSSAFFGLTLHSLSRLYLSDRSEIIRFYICMPGRIFFIILKYNLLVFNLLTLSFIPFQLEKR